eukprot:RCo052930
MRHFERGSPLSGAAPVTTETFFDEAVPVHLKRDDREKACVPLQVLVTVQKRDSSRAVFVRLTDPSDYLLLCACCVREEEYGSFCAANRLRFEFGDLPAKLVTLLRSCARATEQGCPEMYLCLHLERGTGQLQVMQVNQFNESQVLGLRVQQLGDEEHKRFLGEKARLLEEEVRQLQQTVEEHRRELDRLQGVHQRATQQAATELGEWRCKISQLEARKQAELAEQSQAFQAQLTSDRTALETRYSAQLEAAQQQASALQASLAKLTGEKVGAESDLREARSQLASLQSAHQAAVTERDTLREQGQQLSAKVAELTRQLEVGQAQAAAMQQR